MKKNYSKRIRQHFLFTFFMLSFSIHTKAQTLAAGDIAFTGYISNATGTDAFSFVLLVNIPSGTVINFTDNGWTGTALTTTEQTCTWTSGVAMVAGKEITITGPSGAAGATGSVYGGGNPGTVSGLMPSLATSGDQVIAYQGSSSAPTFIAGIHMNEFINTTLGTCGGTGTTTAATWDPACITFPNANASRIPSGLTGGQNAVFISPEQDNAVFANLTGAPLATVAQVRAAVNNSANWTSNSILPTDPGPITIPSRQLFLGGVLPVSITSFTGKLNADKTATLKWDVADQLDIQQYMIEESENGIDFRPLGIVAAVNASSYSYSLTDQQVSIGKNYYRLKTTDLSGKTGYSNIIAITLKAGITVSLYPNPVTDQLIIQQFGTLQNKTATIFDITGRLIQQLNLTNLLETVDMKNKPSGIYILKLEDGSTFKLVKQ